MTTINATMATAAMATMETVDTATITRPFYPALCTKNPSLTSRLSPVGSVVWHVRKGSLDRPELASAYRYHPFSIFEPHIGTDDVFLDGDGPWRVIDLQRTDLLESDGNILVVERAAVV